MNRRRTDRRPSSLVFLFAIFLAAGLAASGGILHAFYKNRQVQISREIEAIDRRIGQQRLDIRTTEMRMDQLLNRFAIRTRIEENGTSLRPIPMGVVEEIERPSLSRHSVAFAVP